MLSAALRRNVGNGTLEYLEQRLLNTLARNVAGDGAVLAAAGYLIYFVDIDYSALRTLDVEIRRLNKAQKYILDILADVARLCEGGSIGYRKGNAQRLCERLSKIGLTYTGRTEQQDVALLQLDLGLFLRRLGFLLPLPEVCFGIWRILL